KKVKLMITYPASTGRNFDEILRVIDSLQLTANYSVATPVNWDDGDDVIIVPSLSDEAAKEKFPGGWKTIKPYLRLVPQPNKHAKSADQTYATRGLAASKRWKSWQSPSRQPAFASR